jgi:threonine synthase
MPPVSPEKKSSKTTTFPRGQGKGEKGESPGPGVLRRYRDHLPISNATPLLYMGEGETPLVRSRWLEKEVGCGALYFKLESCNPTGSFKDRGMVVAVAKAVEEGNKAVMCASTGNTSASAAAFAAHCGLEVYVVVPRGRIAQGKLAQAVAHGAKIIAIDDNFDAALRIARLITDKHPIALVNSVNPYRIEGQKTAAFEIVDALGDAPDYLFIPVGNAGNITAYWRGFLEYYRLREANKRPRMMGFQAAGAAPIVEGKPVADPQTIATAIRIGNPASWESAVAARDESRGVIAAVTDDEIIAAYYRLAREEGIFGEPASAASVAGLLKMAREGLSLAGQTVVCVITGNGLKDPDTAMSAKPDLLELPADLAAIEMAMGWS